MADYRGMPLHLDRIRVLTGLCVAWFAVRGCCGHRPVFVRPNRTTDSDPGHGWDHVDGRAKREAVPGVGRPVPDEQRLYESIMADYQPSVMPRLTNRSRPLVVDFSLRLNQIVTLDERRQVLTTNVFIDQTWHDPALAWEPDKFMDVRALRIPAQHVWLPDTFVYNNADGGSSGYMQGTYVQIQSSGRVLWPVPLRLSSSCTVQITYFPFDSQMCMLKFGSWTYGLRQLDYMPLTDGLTVDPSTYVNNSEWELVSVTMNRTLEEDQPDGIVSPLRRVGPYPHLVYILHLKRNTFFYLFNIIVPCVMLSTLNILTFWLPPVSGEKVTLGLSVFLAFSMFMLLIAEEVPATSEAVPLIGVYLCMVMTMTSVSVLMAVVVTNLYHRGRKMRRAPRWLATLCLRWLAPPCGVLNDIPRIASTVDLVSSSLGVTAKAEHCQYDVSHKKLSLQEAPDPFIQPGAPVSAAARTPPPAGSLPTRLQNGGHLLRDCPLPRDVRFRSSARGADGAVSAAVACMLLEGKGGSGGGWGGEWRGAKELHPRARNSVTSTCRFSHLPAAGGGQDSEHDGDRHGVEDDKRQMEDEEEEELEEEAVWVRRQKLSDQQLSDSSELSGLMRDAGSESEDHETDGDWEGKRHPGRPSAVRFSQPQDHSEDGYTQSLQGRNSAEDVWCPRDHPAQEPCPVHAVGPSLDPKKNRPGLLGHPQNPTQCPVLAEAPRSRDEEVSSREPPRRRSALTSVMALSSSWGRSVRTTLSEALSTSSPLDPHPSSADLQAARVMIAEWQQIAAVADRLLFVGYVLVTAAAYVVILVIVPAHQPPTTTAALGSLGSESVTHFWGG